MPCWGPALGRTGHLHWTGHWPSVHSQANALFEVEAAPLWLLCHFPIWLHSDPESLAASGSVSTWWRQLCLSVFFFFLLFIQPTREPFHTSLILSIVQSPAWPLSMAGNTQSPSRWPVGPPVTAFHDCTIWSSLSPAPPPTVSQVTQGGLTQPTPCPGGHSSSLGWTLDSGSFQAVANSLF